MFRNYQQNNPFAFRHAVDVIKNGISDSSTVAVLYYIYGILLLIGIVRVFTDEFVGHVWL